MAEQNDCIWQSDGLCCCPCVPGTNCPLTQEGVGLCSLYEPAITVEWVRDIKTIACEVSCD